MAFAEFKKRRLLKKMNSSEKEVEEARRNRKFYADKIANLQVPKYFI